MLRKLGFFVVRANPRDFVDDEFEGVPELRDPCSVDGGIPGRVGVLKELEEVEDRRAAERLLIAPLTNSCHDARGEER